MSKSATKSVAATKSTNPYRAGGSYWAIVECLSKLGKGKMHSADALVKMYPSIVGKSEWSEFKSKEARNEETHKDAAARIIQNAIVVNRADYGKPLRSIGFEVRKNRTDDGYQFGLFAVSQAVAKEAQTLKIVRHSRKAPKAIAQVKAPKATSKPQNKGKAAKAPKSAPKSKARQDRNQKQSKGK